MEKSYKFIVNPIAGRGMGALALPEIEGMAKASTMKYEIVCTERPQHAIELAREASINGWDNVIAVGGDGTSNEVLNGLMQARNAGRGIATMGIIGVGRGNDFAFGFGIPAGLEAGFQIIQQNQSGLMDIGYVIGGLFPQGRYFGNGVGIGFDAVVGFEALKLTHLHGFLNYVVAALRTIFLYFHAPLLCIEYDGVTITQPSLMVSIMNGRRMGGGFMMAPHSLPDDGLLDLCIAAQLSRLGILALIPRFMNGSQASHKAIKIGRAQKVHVTALDGVLPAHADGETLCTDGHELSIELIKQPIKILSGHANTT
jgi:diacylglycerol kinase (ATP)